MDFEIVEEIKEYELDELVALYSTIMKEFSRRGINIKNESHSKLDINEYGYYLSKLKEE
jgi:hypothetical protein